MRKPYIGITGFTVIEQVAAILNNFSKDSPRLLMAGVLASDKTLRGERNKYPHRYPPVDGIAKIFLNHPQTLNMIHYHTRDRETLLDQLIEATSLGGPNLHGFQLNVVWPDCLALQRYKSKFPDKKIILQVGSGALAMVGRAPGFLADRVEEYAGLADYVLIDPSGGKGRAMNAFQVNAYLIALRVRNLDMGYGVAGGLNADSLNLVESLIGDFPELSIDAEGRLRTEDDLLDFDLAEQYVVKALELFKK